METPLHGEKINAFSTWLTGVVSRAASWLATASARCCLLAALLFTFVACGKYDKCAKTSGLLPGIFPDYTNVTVPANIAPLNFEIRGAKHVKAEFYVGTNKVTTAEGKCSIDIDKADWSRALRLAEGSAIKVIVSAWTDSCPDGVRFKPFDIYVAKDTIDPWIAYRLIPPGYELWNRMGIFQRNLTSFHQEAIIKNSQNNKGCVNCHTFCQYDPNNWVFHARGKNGSTILTVNGVTRKLPIDKIGPKKSATYPFWHPSGKYIVFSSNKTRQTFYGISRNKIEVFDLVSDLIIYDVKHNTVLTDPRFCGSLDWETFPAFSPDGKYLYFCDAHLDVPAEKRGLMESYFEKLKYALIRVPFDENTGKLGSKVDTMYSPAKEGGSASFPRISPDGRFLLFTVADCATFPIQHVEADLKMIDLTTMKPVDVSILNSDDVDSYHSWSSNGKWIVFSSKRDDGKYTRLYFAHFDPASGKFSKPFMLPQKDPEHNKALMYAYNIPEFIKAKVHLDKEKTADMFK